MPDLSCHIQIPHSKPCGPAFEPLIQQLLQALPAYTNRTLLRTGQTHKYLILASPPDFTPLPASVAQSLNLQIAPETFNRLKQVFFTTLSRHYDGPQRHDHTAYHWLFFSRYKPPHPQQAAATSHCPWQLTQIYSIQGSAAPASTAPLPPIQDGRRSPLAQAVRRWLQDCPIPQSIP